MAEQDWLARVQAAAPAQGRVNPVAHRVLLVDGDALAYTCGGGDSPGQARANLRDRVHQAQRAAGATSTRILLTSRGSPKGGRYAVARAKPYQGQRSSDRRPPQWEYLRHLMEFGPLNIPVETTVTAEADDLFAMHSRALGPGNVVIHTQDKDMRMVPGWHLSWNEMIMVYLHPEQFELTANDKLYGEKWFWTQMLMGDTADNIPGLPRMTKPDGRQVLCGEVTARKLLEDCHTRDEALTVVATQYMAYYGSAAWQAAMLEQGVLLWMRQEPDNVLDVACIGRPLYGVCDPAAEEILGRLTNETQS